MYCCDYLQHRILSTVFILGDTVLILLNISTFDSSTKFYLLRHIQYCAVTLVFLLTVLLHEYSEPRCLY